jgi:hypothetical protein
MYTVEFGPACRTKVELATFELALAFCRGFLACERYDTHNPDNDGPRIVNYGRAELGNDGLTEDEKEDISNV